MTRMLYLIGPLVTGLVAAGVGAAARAQGPATPGPGYPGGAPGTNNPFARPNEMGENDRITDREEQIRVGTQAAADRRAAEAARNAARPAKADEVKAGLAVADSRGAAIGVVESVESDGAVVAAAAGKVKVPLEAFGIGRKGLLLGVSKRDFDGLVAKAHAAPAS